MQAQSKPNESPHMSILVLEDHVGEQFVAKELLSPFGHVDCIQSLEELEVQLKAKTYTLILADLLVDDGNFLDFIMSPKRTQLGHTPFLVVSSLDDETILRN